MQRACSCEDVERDDKLAAEFYRLAQAAMLTKLRFRPTNAPLGVFSFRINYYTGLQEDLMDGIKQN